MTAVLYVPHFVQFFDDNGDPLAGGLLYTYVAGTTSPKATFTTAAGSTENTNPIVLDSAGRARLFLSGAYKFVLKTSAGVDVSNGTTDNVTAFTTTGTSAAAFFQTFSGTGAQQAFILSENLGTDEKIIMVFVDQGAGKGFDIQPTSAYTLDGTTLTITVAPASGSNNIQVWAPSQLTGAASAAAAAAEVSAGAALTSANNAAASAASVSPERFTGTSATSLLIGTGSKVFTTQSGKFFDAGIWLLVTSNADPTNFMHGQVTTYSTTTLTLNVTNTGGSGTLADWTIRLSGTRGATGPTGSISDISGSPAAAPTLTDIVIFADVSASNATKTTTHNDILDLKNQSTKVYQTTGVSQGTSAWTTMTFDTEEWDDAAWHSVATNTERITFDFTGRVLVNVCHNFTTTANSNYGIRIYKNGTIIAKNYLALASHGEAVQMPLTIETTVVPTDYVYYQAYQASGGAVTSGTGIGGSTFSARRTR